MLSDDLLRRALRDPFVRKRRVHHWIAGVFIDQEDLTRALARLGAEGDDLVPDVEANLGAVGGHRRTYAGFNRLLRIARSASGGSRPRDRRAELWLPISEYQRIRRPAPGPPPGD